MGGLIVKNQFKIVSLIGIVFHTVSKLASNPISATEFCKEKFAFFCTFGRKMNLPNYENVAELYSIFDTY